MCVDFSENETKEGRFVLIECECGAEFNSNEDFRRHTCQK